MQTRIALTGDIMLARGIDQIQRSRVDPELHEPAVRDARDYIALAEEASGDVPRDVEPAYVWGDSLATLSDFAPHATVLNVETSITRSDDFDPTKGIHYRAHPDNAAILSQVPAPVCTLANNHVFDLGRRGFEETLATLDATGLPRCGAGLQRTEARRPATVPRTTHVASSPADGSPPPRVVVIGCCTGDSGVPREWGAGEEAPGVFYLDRLYRGTAEDVARIAARERTPGTVVVVSIHWGGNWGYRVGPEQREFAHALIDTGAVDVVHGHSSHHPRPFEIYRDKPVLYGCGDFINDYEGIRGHESYRPTLTVLYLVTVDPETAAAGEVRLVPFEIRRFRLHAATGEQSEWIASRLERENRSVNGPGIRVTPHGLFIA